MEQHASRKPSGQPSGQPSDGQEYIYLRNARANNLKGVTLRIPRGKLVVVTGVSGSGKSSLAFDTLYAEGRRRYVESLSAYARQFLGRMPKPACDFIDGLPPAIAIGQRVRVRNPRSTVGTATEVYDYLRMLYARIGRTVSPVSGEEVRRHTVDDVVRLVDGFAEGTRFMVLAPLRVSEGRGLRRQLGMCVQEGFSRVLVGGEARRIVELLEDEDFWERQREAFSEDNINKKNNFKKRPQEFFSEDNTNNLKKHPQEGLWLVIDRLRAGGDASRLRDSCETAFYEGDGACRVVVEPSGLAYDFSSRFEADGMAFEEPSDGLFAFNSPQGACPRCEGFGSVVGVDERLVVPDRSLSVHGGCVQCWHGAVMQGWQREFMRRAAVDGFPIFKPYMELTVAERGMLWHGLPSDMGRPLGERACIDGFFKMLQDGCYKIQYRVMLSRYRGRTVCPDCHGTRLRKEASWVLVGGRAITELVEMPIARLRAWFDGLVLTAEEGRIAERLLREVRQRLKFLDDVGLGYLTLNRSSNTLSGGESQRINLTTSIGSPLVGSLYILDEPSVGLHSRDTARLIGVMRALRGVGNTVVVVEHDEEIMRAADWLIDVGPDAGRLGGEIVYQGPPPSLGEEGRSGSEEIGVSHTLDYLTGRAGRVEAGRLRRRWNLAVKVVGARMNNLRGIDVTFPLNVLTVVTGVSGSGKSSLVEGILYRGLRRGLDEVAEVAGEHSAIVGDVECIKHVELVGQEPLGKSSRSNPATYVKAYDELRRLYASQPLARQLGLTAQHFSFNAEGGRCEACGGTGEVTVEMQFMADLTLRCEACGGRRFKREVLDVLFHGRSIADALDMTVEEAMGFFGSHGARGVVERLRPLAEVGLGYVRLGQGSSTLSGGECQRVKLAAFLGRERVEPTLFIFDEPTVGLHFHDTRLLLAAFGRLLDRGHSVVVVEHNLDVVAAADHVVDLGPEGGDGGGRLVVAGTPEEVAACEASVTGRMLRRFFGEV